MTDFPKTGDNFTTLGQVSGFQIIGEVADSITRQIAEKAITRAEADGDTETADYYRRLYRGWLEDGGPSAS